MKHFLLSIVLLSLGHLAISQDLPGQKEDANLLSDIDKTNRYLAVFSSASIDEKQQALLDVEKGLGEFNPLVTVAAARYAQQFDPPKGLRLFIIARIMTFVDIARSNDSSLNQYIERFDQDNLGFFLSYINSNPTDYREQTKKAIQIADETQFSYDERWIDLVGADPGSIMTGALPRKNLSKSPDLWSEIKASVIKDFSDRWR